MKLSDATAKLKSVLADVQIDPQAKALMRELVRADLASIDAWVREGAKGAKTPEQVRLGVQGLVQSIRYKLS